MKRLLSVFLCCLILCTVCSAENKPFVIDNADLLTPSQEEELTKKITSISTTHSFDIVLLSVDESLGGKTPEQYADDYYDTNGYGHGAGRDGVLLLLSMKDRDWHLSTCGRGITAFTDYGIDRVETLIIPYFSEEEYAEGYRVFLTMCEDLLIAEENDTPYDTDHHYPGEESKYTEELTSQDKLIFSFVAVGGAILLAFLILSLMRRKLKSVRPQALAHSYIREGSFVLTREEDLFLYSNVVSVPKPKDNGGGSSTHFSSGGISHGGGGGKF